MHCLNFVNLLDIFLLFNTGFHRGRKEAVFQNCTICYVYSYFPQMWVMFVAMSCHVNRIPWPHFSYFKTQRPQSFPVIPLDIVVWLIHIYNLYFILYPQQFIYLWPFMSHWVLVRKNLAKITNTGDISQSREVNYIKLT